VDYNTWTCLVVPTYGYVEALSKLVQWVGIAVVGVAGASLIADLRYYNVR
jgi:hypothetical protein